MLVVRIFVTATEIESKKLVPLTAGMVGAEVEVIFDRSWDGFLKTFVWSHYDVTIDDTTASGKIPAEVLEKPGDMLKFGVYGVNDGHVLPTLWTNIGKVYPSADPSGDASTDPALPVWAQLQADMEKLKNADSDAITDEEYELLLAALEGSEEI